MTQAYRTEHDTMGDIEVDASKFWGAQTERSRRNFKIGSERMPLPIIHALAQIKWVAASVNAALGKIPTDIEDAIKAGADHVLAGNADDHFPLLVWQTGSGTQTNMNVNEVIAHLANKYLIEKSPGTTTKIHPNDHVNCSQSSNDSFPTAMHIAAVKALHDGLFPALNHMLNALSEKAYVYKDIIKIARTHLQDATPMTVGQEFSAYATQVRLGIERIESALPHLYAIAQGGTAVGTGLNTPKDFAEQFAALLSERLKLPFKPADNFFEALATHDSILELSGQLNVLAASFMKIANDIRLLASGPRCGFGELHLPENEPGSSIMPGKVNPTQVEALTMVCAQVMGNHVTITVAAAHGHFQLNVFKPVIALNILQSIDLLTSAVHSFTDNCLIGLTVNETKVNHYVDRSLMLGTALAPVIGYENAATVIKKALAEDISLKEACLKLGLLDEETFNTTMNIKNMTGISD